MGETSVLKRSDPLELGRKDSVLRFGEGHKRKGAWAGIRYLYMADRPIFELSFWCGTCPFLFERLGGATETVSIDRLEDTLATGIDDFDPQVVEAFGGLLPKGRYVPLLLEIAPRLVYPMKPGDYFSEEQVRHQGLNGFWGLPEHPHTPYYRGDQREIDAGNRLFEFIVPIVPPSWNDADRVSKHRERLKQDSRPTAVAVSIVDITRPEEPRGPEGDQIHWGLVHFLLDGHHKLQAAAEGSRSLRLLSLLSLENGLSKEEDAVRVADQLGKVG